MELLPYLITFAVGLAVGIFVEWKYGSKLSAENAAAHAALTQATAAVNQAATAIGNAVKPTT